jgi:hypothetical protein
VQPLPAGTAGGNFLDREGEVNLLARVIGCCVIAISGTGMVMTAPNNFCRWIGVAVEGLGLFLLGRKDTF